MATWMVQISLILIVSVVLGRLAEKVGQNRMVGEIGAGLLLGASVLGVLWPEGYSVLLFTDSLEDLKVLADLGLVLLMFEVAWHTSSLHAKKERNAILTPLVITLFGVSLTFLIGCLIATVSKESVAPDIAFWPYVFFCGLALSATALPVLIRIIARLKNISASTASVALSSAVYTDVFAWVGVAFLAASYSAGKTSITGALISILSLIGFCGISFFVIRPLISLLYREREAKRNNGIQLVVVICYCLASAEVTSQLGFHQAIGVVIAAYVFCKVPGLKRAWTRTIGNFAHIFFIPIFFAYSGLQVSVGYFSQFDTWLWLGIFLVGGFLGKVVGTYLGGRICGLSPTIAMEVGLLMNTKGLVELVILSIGLQLGVLSEKAYGIFLIVALLSIVMTPPLLTFFAKLCRRDANVQIKVAK
jgi:Kef-type K+ transport system membrane component KefB